MRTFLYIVLILLFIVYVKLYLSKRYDFQIIQTELTTISPDIILEKYPIYIRDMVVSLDDLIKSIFKYQYTRHNKSYTLPNTEITTQATFTIFHNTTGSSHIVQLKNIGEFVDIILEPFNILIIPFNWTYLTDDKHVVHELYSWIHLGKRSLSC